MSLFRLNFWQSYLKSAVKQNKWPYIFQLDFYLKGDRLAYVNISISVLGWSKRVQFEEL